MDGLTEQQLGYLIGLVLKEARRKGYGTKYYEDNRKAWPESLRRLRTIVRKLRAHREMYYGKR